MCRMTLKSYDSAAGLLEAIDELGLPRGTWVATDADGTLWATDVADVAWARLHTERAMRPAAAAVMRRLLDQVGAPSTGDAHRDASALYDGYHGGRVTDTHMLVAMTACYAGWTEKALREFGRRVAEQVAPRAYATTRDLLEGLARRGLNVAIVSGSPRVLVEESVGALGLDLRPLVVGAEVACQADFYTDSMVEPIPWEGGKVKALALHAPEAPVAMGDTLGDLGLLEAARALRVLVHPRPGLRAKVGAGPWVEFMPRRTVGGDEVLAHSIDRAIAPKKA